MAQNDLEVAAPLTAAMDDHGDAFTVMGMRFAWMRFAFVCAQHQRFLRGVSSAACARALHSLHPTLAASPGCDERRVGCGKFAYELRFIVDVLV